MQRSVKSLILAAALAAATVVAAFTTRRTEAAVHSTGPHRACYNYVAIRDSPGDSTARDNLAKHQTFVVTGGVGRHYVYGYKLVNGVHGWVLSSSIDKSCP
jgi:long-subunit fatty acid transport protein